MMTEENGIENEEQMILKSFSDCCKKISTLKKTDAVARRNVLKEIHNTILVCDSSLFQKDSSKCMLESLIKSLISTMSDDSEKCREISVATLKIIFNLYVSDDYLPSLLKVLANRLGKTDERERSEEIRLLEIELLIQLIGKMEDSLFWSSVDISFILSTCIVDDCPEIKRKSCEFLLLLASKKKSKFHIIAGSFLKPLLLSISHQHMKTRVLCIKALGSIADFLSFDEFEHAVSHLAQRLFDHSPTVRLAVTEVIGAMLLKLNDRYSYFHRLIPLMLSTLYDEVPEISTRGRDLWSSAGSQYLKENEKDYKDLIDFPQQVPENYPCFVEERPPPGCRILVQRNIYKIFPPLVVELSDWVKQTRLKCSKVLYSIILHSEEKITIQLTSAVEGIAFVAKDDSECVEWAIKAAEILGFFVDPNLLCDSIMMLMFKTPSAAHLSIFAASLRGHYSTYSDQCFEVICKFLTDPSICRLRKPEEQANLLLCIEALLSSGNVIYPEISEYMFTVLSSISGLTTNDEICEKAEELFKLLAAVRSTCLQSIFKEHALKFIKFLTANYELWNQQSPEMPIFKYLVQTGLLNEEVMKIIIPILNKNLHPSKDAKHRSNILRLLIPVFQSLSTVEDKVLIEKMLELIRTGIFPNLVWMAGKTASKIRTLASASLFEIIAKTTYSSLMIKSLGDEILPILATLANDEESVTRVLACKMLETVLPRVNGIVDEHKIHNTCFEILHCMDDESDDVRLMTVRVLKAYVTSFPSDYNWNMYKSYVKNIYENVLVHMDDKNEKIRQSVLTLLKEIGYAAPDVLLDEVESKRYVMTANDLCDNLIEHIKKIKV